MDGGGEEEEKGDLTTPLCQVLFIYIFMIYQVLCIISLVMY